MPCKVCGIDVQPRPFGPGAYCDPCVNAVREREAAQRERESEEHAASINASLADPRMAKIRIGGTKTNAQRAADKDWTRDH